MSVQKKKKERRTPNILNLQVNKSNLYKYAVLSPGQHTHYLNPRDNELILSCFILTASQRYVMTLITAV